MQLTYSTSGGEKFSFHVAFPEPCTLDVDDCSVDMGEENIVLLLRKDLPEGDDVAVKLWERFSVGLNASQTTVKH